MEPAGDLDLSYDDLPAPCQGYPRMTALQTLTADLPGPGALRRQAPGPSVQRGSEKFASALANYHSPKWPTGKGAALLQ